MAGAKHLRKVAFGTKRPDVEGILRGLESENEIVRAAAVRSVCPCRMGWGPFERCMPIVVLLQKDSSQVVRAAAKHVIEEAYQLQGSGLPTTPQEGKNEMVAARRHNRWRRESV